MALDNGLAIGWGYLNHSQPGASLHQVKEIYIAGSKSQMNRLLIGVQIGDLISGADYSNSHLCTAMGIEVRGGEKGTGDGEELSGSLL
jgi:hypothetical protein